MKKIILGLALLAGGAALTSCDMDTTRYGVISQENAIDSRNDAANFLNGIYIQIRNMSAGVKYSASDLQADKFVGTVSNGNRNGNFSTGQIVVSDQDITGFYETAYDAINEANYFIPRVETLMAQESTTPEVKEELASMIGVAHFCRALSYVYLFDRFVNYNAADLNTPGKGLQLVKTYNPSGDRSTYVGRSTIAETVEYINGELTAAFNALKDWDDTGRNQDNIGPETAYLNEFVVAALQARFALLTQDYATALAKAEFVINSGVYDLVAIEDYKDMWIYDRGSELIFVPFASSTGGGGFNIGGTWVSSASQNTSDYIPTADALMAYGDGDIRFDAFFTLYGINSAGVQCEAYAFTKFPGDPDLFTTTSNNLLNKAKPFRLSELYLIAAEACTAEGATKNETKANEYLNALRENRISNYQAATASGANLVNAVRAERALELIGEGFRLSDLRRWGLGFTRTAGFASIDMDDVTPFVQNTTSGITYQAGDYRFLWPIPYREMSVNPQLAGQQNPGY